MTHESTRRDVDLTESQEDYLKQILMLAEGEGSVSTQALADRLKVRPASVTGMLQRLDQLGLVDYRRYRGVRLSGRESVREGKGDRLLFADATGSRSVRWVETKLQCGAGVRDWAA